MPNRSERRHLYLAAGAVLAAAGAGWLWRHAAAAGSGPLELRETSAVSLGDTITVGGVVGGFGHRLLVWSPGRQRLILFEHGARRTLHPRELLQPVGAAFTGTAGRLEVFDGPRGALLAVEPGGAVASTRIVPTLQRTVMATRARSGWYAVVPDRSELQHTLYYLAEGAAPRPLKRFRRLTPQALPDIRLSPVGDDVLVTQANAPFAALRIDPRGATTRITGGFERLGIREDSASARVADALWVSLPMIPLGRRYLQTLVNLRGDRRLLLTFDPSGRGPARQRAIDAPVTFFAAVPQTHTLLALRQLGDPEIVEYAWSD